MLDRRQILAALGIHEMILLTNTHHSPVALSGYGLSIVEERPIRKAGRHIERERRAVPAQDRQRVLQIVAIAVVEGEADEAAAEIALGHSPVHLVERDDVDVGAPQSRQHVVEELRRDFQQPVRLERVRARRPHVMQRQDRADAAEQRLQHAMCAGEVQRLQRGAQNGLLHSGHDDTRRDQAATPLMASASSAGGAPVNTAMSVNPAFAR